MPKKDSLKKFTSNVFWLIMGALASWIISNHYNNISAEEQRDILLENGLLEVKINTEHVIYEPYIDTFIAIDWGRPFPYLTALSIQEIYKNINIFDPKDSLVKSRLIRIVTKCMHNVDAFNDNIRLRNNFILVDVKNVKELNHGVFETYHRIIIPCLTEFREFVQENKETLIK